MGSSSDETKEENDTAMQLEKELQKHAPRVINHMNRDHRDSIKAYALAFGDHPKCTDTASALLTGLDREGFTLDVTLADGTTLRGVRVAYRGEVTKGKDLHTVAVSMHRAAYDKIGVVYKVRHGYYQQVAKMIGFLAYKKVNARPGKAMLAVSCAAVAGIVISRHLSTHAGIVTSGYPSKK